ncbi:hypothetical protein FXO37_03656 [Capsicum annuum]|nr:hypothetical protein FXO37_03656 [Capsicum annuum]
MDSSQVFVNSYYSADDFAALVSNRHGNFVMCKNSSNDCPLLASNLPSIELDEEEKSQEDFGKPPENCINNFHALESILPASIETELEEEKLREDFDKPAENTINDFPALESILPSIETKEEQSCEEFDKSENSINDDFSALVSNLKSVVITQEAPATFSYATMLAKKTSAFPSAMLAQKVVRVAPSDTESRPRTGQNIAVGPKEKVVCIRGLPKNLKAVELIQALKKFGPVKLASLQIKRSDFGSCSCTLEFQSHDSARAAVETGKIKFGEHGGFVSFKSAPPRYGSSMNWSRGR